jgi:acyl-CoA thioester hydrolase
MPVHIRYADIDMMQHVNNVTYLTYLEQARICYARDVLGWDGRMETLNIIVAHQRYDYVKPVFLTDTLEIWTRVSRMGSKSLDLDYLAIRLDRNRKAEITGRGLTTLVVYDFAKDRSLHIPEEWRTRVADYEPLVPEQQKA